MDIGTCTFCLLCTAAILCPVSGFYLYNVKLDLCATMKSESEGIIVTLRRCKSDSSNQLWRWKEHTLVNQGTGLCLTVAPPVNRPEGVVQPGLCTGGLSRRWFWSENSEKMYAYTSESSFCLIHSHNGDTEKATSHLQVDWCGSNSTDSDNVDAGMFWRQLNSLDEI